VPFVSYGAGFMPTGDCGWGLLPGSLAGAVRWIHREFNAGKLDVPIMVTGHGVADAEDIRRQWFLKEALWHLSLLPSENVPITGYIHWSLIDCYEWTEGTDAKYGLAKVDFATQARRPRKSAGVYASVIRRTAQGFGTC